MHRHIYTIKMFPIYYSYWKLRGHMGIGAHTHTSTVIEIQYHTHTHTHTHIHTHIYTDTQGMTEWPGAVMGEWAVIWRGEPGEQEKRMELKDEKR